MFVYYLQFMPFQGTGWEWIACVRGYNFFMLNSAEHELLNAHKNTNIKKRNIFQAQMNLEY